MAAYIHCCVPLPPFPSSLEREESQALWSIVNGIGVFAGGGGGELWGPKTELQLGIFWPNLGYMDPKSP